MKPGLFDVVVVGAGLSGLMASCRLVDAGLDIIVVEREPVPGGRLATIQSEVNRADIGAQFFTVRTSEFQSVVDRWLAEFKVAEWSRGWPDGSSADTVDGYPRYMATDGFGALANYLSDGLPIRKETNLQAVLADDDRWLIRARDGWECTSKVLILTPPIPQSLALLKSGGARLPEVGFAALEPIDYAPCLCGVFRVEGELLLPEPGALQRPGCSISWIADNRRKGLGGGETGLCTVQANAEASVSRWEDPDEVILSWMGVELMSWLAPGSRISPTTLKRWPHATPLATYPARCLELQLPAPLILAGDAFDGPRVEGAALSGLAAADAAINMLQERAY